MKITPTPRIVYDKNPLIEVVCQIRFEPIEDLGEIQHGMLEDFSHNQYVVHEQEQSFQFTVDISAETGMSTPMRVPEMHIFHALTLNKSWQASFCREHLTLTCFKYENWIDFLTRTLKLFEILNKNYPEIKVQRIGLRYRNLIEREALGLAGTPWHELINPFLLGPLAHNAFSDTEIPSDADVLSMLSQVMIKIEDCTLLLKSTLLSSIEGNEKAFLIDADFLHEYDCEKNTIIDPETLTQKLEALHANAGSLFRRCIQEKLHHALHQN